jgi:hypothetical protein
MTYRVGNHSPLKVYRDAEDIGVMYTAEDAALVVEALNERAEVDDLRTIVAKAEDDQCGCLGGPLTIEWAIPLGPACICDGSGRTCPRHGAVM